MANDKRKLDIRRVLRALDERNHDFLDQLTAEERKEYNPWLVMRFLSFVHGRNGAHYLCRTNERVNRRLSRLKDHPDLLWRLMCTVGVGRRQDHDWVPPPPPKRTHKINEFLLRWYPHANDLELSILLNQFTEATFAEFVHATAVADDEAADLIDDYGRLHGRPPTRSKRRKRA